MEEMYGVDYRDPWKWKIVGSLINEILNEDDKPSSIMEVGAGKYPMSECVEDKKHKILQIDVGGPENKAVSISKLQARYDIENIIPTDENKEEMINNLERFNQLMLFLNSDYAEEKPESIDLLIFSDTLNYVDYKSAIKAIKKYLWENGKLAIYNCPERGETTYKRYFSEKGAKSNIALVKFLLEEGFIIKTLKLKVVDNGEIELIDLTSQPNWYEKIIFGEYPEFDKGSILIDARKMTKKLQGDKELR